MSEYIHQSYRERDGKEIEYIFCHICSTSMYITQWEKHIESKSHKANRLTNDYRCGYEKDCNYCYANNYVCKNHCLNCHVYKHINCIFHPNL